MSLRVRVCLPVLLLHACVHVCPSMPKCAQVCPSVPMGPSVPKCARMKSCARCVSVRVSVDLSVFHLHARRACVCTKAQVCPSVPKWAHGPTCAHVCTNEMAAVVNVTQLRPCHTTNENACIHAWRVFIGGHTCGHMSIGMCPALSSRPSDGLCALF